MTDTHHKDRNILRELAGRLAEIASLPIQEEKRSLWRQLNALKPVRPMVMIDQVCWNELAADETLTLRCTDPECRSYEESFRRTLYQWQHFPVDRVVEPFVLVNMAITNTGFGIQVNEAIAVSDPQNDVVGHQYNNQFQTMDDLEKIKIPKITHDPVETRRRLDLAHELFDGLLEVRPWGYDPHYMTLWDPISTWMGVENALFALVDQPGLIHGILERMTAGTLSMLDQLESQGLLCQPQSLIHCTGAYTNELPAPGYHPNRPRLKDLWMYSMAQMFSTVSPRMFKEFEVDYVSRICERFGLVYYGCCDPLDKKMKQVRMLPNVRKVSMSPWADQARGAAEIGTDYVFSRKPNPALLTYGTFDPELIRQDLQATLQVCLQHNCPVELILKDISTLRYQPERLFQWAEVARQVVEQG